MPPAHRTLYPGFRQAQLIGNLLRAEQPLGVVAGAEKLPALRFVDRVDENHFHLELRHCAKPRGCLRRVATNVTPVRLMIPWST